MITVCFDENWALCALKWRVGDGDSVLSSPGGVPMLGAGGTWPSA